MQAVVNNDPKPWMCNWQGVPMKPRIVNRNRVGAFLSVDELTMTASELFHEICFAAWRFGEPGLLYIDEINRFNPLPGQGRLETTNPCGEQALGNFDVWYGSHFFAFCILVFFLC
jgi:ribonucleotide reductase alpha subunit